MYTVYSCANLSCLRIHDLMRADYFVITIIRLLRTVINIVLTYILLIRTIIIRCPTIYVSDTLTNSSTRVVYLRIYIIIDDS